MSTGYAFAQNETVSKDSVTISEDSVKEKTTLTLATLYGSNVDYYGQISEQRLPYLALNATVRTRPGIYFSATGFHLFSDSLFVSATSLGVGYEFKITPKFTGDLSFNHTFFPSGSPFLQAGRPNQAGLDLAYQHLFKTELGGDLSFGTDLDYFTTLTNSKAFNFSVSKNKAILSFTPELAVIAGTQQFYQEYLIREEKNNKGKGKGSTGILPVEILTTVNYKQFGLLSYNLKLPLAYNRASYLVEAAVKFALLGNNAVNKGDLNTFFTLGFYYQF
ncbi:hypothetical protein NIASO_08970 [Niabella soli DSM 19437]|uniref:Uncharacterized protein n=2 Tax=Niabella TaxID=379899 RepID=W0EWS1_9BACT|nr:hypothetical protein NIASO_08970 [Niabella soli DSM 19437]